MSKILIISEAIKQLEEVKSKKGDIEVFVDITEMKVCKTCGEDRDITHCGEARYIIAANINGKVRASVVSDMC